MYASIRMQFYVFMCFSGHLQDTTAVRLLPCMYRPLYGRVEQSLSCVCVSVFAK